MFQPEGFLILLVRSVGNEASHPEQVVEGGASERRPPLTSLPLYADNSRCLGRFGTASGRSVTWVG